MTYRFASAAVAVLLLSGAAAAQKTTSTTIGGMAIPAEELESVRNHCDTLAAANRTGMSQPGTEAQGQGDHEENTAAEGGEDNAAGQGNAQGSTTLTEADDVSPAETAGTIDLEGVTLEDCVAADLARTSEQAPA
jgi:hypothetical protein